MTSSFENDELETSVASDARGFLNECSRAVWLAFWVFGPECDPSTSSRVSDLRLGAMSMRGRDGICQVGINGKGWVVHSLYIYWNGLNFVYALFGSACSY